MADKTGIEWSRGDDGSPGSTWNPLRGCTRVSPGCGGPGLHGGCYAERVAARFSGPGQPYEGIAEMRGGKPRWTGKLALAPEHILTAPLRWKRPRRIFVNSMSDLFHEAVPDAWIDQVFVVMALAPQHTFQVLTKRSARMRAYVERLSLSWILRLSRAMNASAEMVQAADRPGRETPTWPPPNVWLGVSTEDQRRANERVPDLLATPAAVRFVSAEPLLGPIDLSPFMWPVHGWWKGPHRSYAEAKAAGAECGLKRQALVWAGCTFLDWIIVGGESGPNARPMHPTWGRDIRNQCAAAGVAFHFKQWGGWAPVDLDGTAECRDWLIVDRDGDVDVPDERAPDEGAGEVAMRRVGKKVAGRLLDGVEHNGMPAARA